MARLKVLMVVEAARAGVGRHVLDLAEGLAQKGDSVDLAYCASRAGAAFKSRLKKLSIRRAEAIPGRRRIGFSDVAAVRAVRRIMEEGGPYDIVHGHASKGGLYARASKSRSGPAVIYTPNAFITQSPQLGPVERLLYTSAERLLSRRTDGLIHVAPEEQRHAQNIRLSPALDRVVPNGLALRGLPAREEVRAELGFDDDSVLVVGFVGRLSEQKGPDLLLSAAARLNASADWSLAIVGSGAEEARLRALSDRLGLSHRVRWLGERDGQRSMRAFDLLVVPSRYEGLPYVVLEGLWAGLPVIATSSSSVELVLGDGRTGLVSDSHPAALAQHISRLLDDDDLRADRARSAVQVVRAFSVEAMIERTRSFYTDVLTLRRQRQASA